MSDNYSKKIEKYFSDEFSEAERTAFEQELAKDTELAKSFAQRKEIEDFLAVRPGREKLKAEIGELGDSFFSSSNESTTKVVPLRRRLYWIAGAAAAAILLLLLVPTWLNSPPTYQQFAEHRPLSLQERGSDQKDLQAIETAFNTGNYSSAAELLNQYLEEQPDDLQAQIYASIAALELDRAEEALTRLSPISTGTSIYRSTAQWYLALVYLKQKNYQESRTALSKIPADNYWHTKAQDLLKKLPQE
ncbi:MAG: hypothetical protein HRU41_18410 [Saprospiraceae bacterium]|nr:hypothetical protein [Saprospiraceae bacterium]